MNILYKTKNYNIHNILVITIIIMAIIYFITQSGDSSLSLFDYQTYDINEDWTITRPDNSTFETTLPIDLDFPQNTVYQASRTLPSLPPDNHTLLIRSSMQFINVFVDEQLIFTNETKHDKSNMILASVWYLINIPENYAGKVLRIEYYSPTNSFSGIINPLKLGEKHNLLMELFLSELVGFMVFFMLFLTSIVLLVFSFVQNVNSRILHLSLIGFISGIWIISESKLIQFFIPSRPIIGSISYIALPLITFSLAIYIRETTVKQVVHKRLMLLIAIANLVLLFVVFGLQLTGVSYLLDSFRYALSVIIISLILGLVILILEYIKYHNETVKHVFKYIIILAISVITELIVFYLKWFKYTSHTLRVGILIIYMFLLWDYYNYYKETLNIKQEQIILKKWAYRDFLTDGNNRNAYERDVDLLIDSGKSFRLVIADMNYLKHINDNFGHVVGDKAIKSVFTIINNSFYSSKCYRIGGDEIAILDKNIEIDHYNKCIQEFDCELTEFNKNNDYNLVMAIGTGVFDAALWDNFDHFYHEVDRRMYHHKAITKAKALKNAPSSVAMG